MQSTRPRIGRKQVFIHHSSDGSRILHATASLNTLTMALLPLLRSDFVYSGYWRNLTAPVYRQWLWTMTDELALVVLGTLGLTASMASVRLWPILKRGLQPEIQLPGAQDSSQDLAMTQAIQALGAWLSSRRAECAEIWQSRETLTKRTRAICAVLLGSTDRLQPADCVRVSPLYGVCALFNIVVFAVLGVIIPYFLSGGLQGETIVQARKGAHRVRADHLFEATHSEQIRNRVDWDLHNCVMGDGSVSSSTYCTNAFEGRRRVLRRDLGLDDALFEEDPYRFLRAHGLKDQKAYQVSRNLTLQDVGSNVRPLGQSLLHELTCVPVSLDAYITRRGGTMESQGPQYELNISSALPDGPWKVYENRPGRESFLTSISLLTSNGPDSGREAFRAGPSRFQLSGPHLMASFKASIRDTRRQDEVDAPLPWLDLKNGAVDFARHLRYAVQLILDGPEGPLQNFMIVFKLAETRTKSSRMVDDPVFSAHTRVDNDGYVADREFSALGCAEVFKQCTQSRCESLPTNRPTVPGRPGDAHGYLRENYVGIASTFIASILAPSYGNISPNYKFSTWNAQSRSVYGTDSPSDIGHTWRADIDRRFLRSISKVKHAAKWVAERDIDDASFKGTEQALPPAPTLFTNPDFTTLNLCGLLATFCTCLYLILASYWFVLLAPLAGLIDLCVLLIMSPYRLYSLMTKMRTPMSQKVLRAQVWPGLSRIASIESRASQSSDRSGRKGSKRSHTSQSEQIALD